MAEIGHTTKIQNLLEDLRKGTPEAREALIAHACVKLRAKAKRMLKDYARVRRWEETDDVLQKSLLRLHKALESIQPDTKKQFYGLATTQIRRELIDLARHFYGAEGQGKHHHSDGGNGAPHKPDLEPSSLEAWADFHELVDSLPDEQKELVDLLFYEEIPQAEAAEVLGISLATLKRRWQAVRIILSKKLDPKDFA